MASLPNTLLGMKTVAEQRAEMVSTKNNRQVTLDIIFFEGCLHKYLYDFSKVYLYLLKNMITDCNSRFLQLK